MVDAADKGWVKYMMAQDSRVKNFLIGVDSGAIILDKQFLENLNDKYRVQQEEIRKRIQSIKNGVEFGEVGTHYDEYYPCRFIRVINEERGIIEFEEAAIHRIGRESVLNLFIKAS